MTDIREQVHGHPFYLQDGTEARSVPELKAHLLRMSEGMFMHHANREKNDFANWVQDVYGDTALASLLRKATSAADAAAAIERRLDETRKRVETAVRDAPKQTHTLTRVTAQPVLAKPELPKPTIRQVRLPARQKLPPVQSLPETQRSVMHMAKKTIKEGIPKATQFLTAYMAMQRPTTTHLYMSKGIVDFLLGLVVGVLVGIVIANMLS